MIKKIVLSLCLSAAFVTQLYSMESAAGSVSNQAAAQPWRKMFPDANFGSVPIYWFSSMLLEIEQMLRTDWDGVLKPYYWKANNTPESVDSLLNKITDKINQLLAPPGRLTFKHDTGYNDRTLDPRLILDTVDATIEIPFPGTEIINQIISGSQILEDSISNKVPKKTQILGNLSLGNVWATLGTFIDHYKTGFSEASYLLEFKEISLQGPLADLKKATHENLEKLQTMSELYNEINAEMDKPAAKRDNDKLAKISALIDLLREIKVAIDVVENGILAQLINFFSSQPALEKLKAILASKDHPEPARPETTADMLNRLLNVPVRSKEIAQAVSTVGLGWAPPTLRLSGKLWNVYKLTDPNEAELKKAAQYLAQYSASDPNLYHPRNDFHPIVAEINTLQAKNEQYLIRTLGAVEMGSYVLLTRQADSSRHVYSVDRFTVYRSTNWPVGLKARWVGRVGLVEILEAKAGDQVEFYDPLRIHGGESIQGTVMEQRIHAIMGQERVHQYSALSPEAKEQIRNDVKQYNEQRMATRMENQGLSDMNLTPEERTLAEAINPDSEDAKNIAVERAHKVSAELKDRLTNMRVSRLRTHGDEIAQNPEQLLQYKVHDLFNPLRMHENRDLTAKERQFFGGNYGDGYLDTVENAIAEKQRRLLASKQQHLITAEEKVHYDPQRTHLERTHYKSSYNVAVDHGASGQEGSSASNGMAATPANYEHLAEALNDYEMQSESRPQNLLKP